MTLISTNTIGKPVSRVDGPAKVTGQAKYAAEFNVPGLAHGFVVSSTIAKGRIKKIDRSGRARSSWGDRGARARQQAGCRLRA